MAMTGYTVPPGWNYNAMYDGYVNVQGLKISKLDVINHGSIVKAIIAIHGPQALQMATGHISQAAVQNGGFVAQTIDNLSVGKGQSYSFANPRTNVISIETKLGRISVDTETGDITVPVGVGREADGGVEGEIRAEARAADGQLGRVEKGAELGLGPVVP